MSGAMPEKALERSQGPRAGQGGQPASQEAEQEDAEVGPTSMEMRLRAGGVGMSRGGLT